MVFLSLSLVLAVMPQHGGKVGSGGNLTWI